MAVRALYFDIQAWAAHEPETWAVWAAPCPIPNREVRAGAQRRRRTRERMADRTRTLTPLLPLLVEHVETHHRHLAELLTAASAAPAGRAAGRRLAPLPAPIHAAAITPMSDGMGRQRAGA